MNPEQKKFLQGRFRLACLAQPEVKQLKSLLLRFGGEYLVAPPSPDRDLPALLESGFCTNGPITLRPMIASSCHRNIASLWKKRKHGICGVATGYALSRDGLWRQHSWGILRDGVLETTEERLKYFGILLQATAADRFSASNATE